MCFLAKEEKEVKLWHRRLGHLHLRGMKKIISKEAVRGIPKLLIDEGKVCGECQVGKQTKMSHPKLGHPTTSKTLELLHMDLMGPMQVESLGGKRWKMAIKFRFHGCKMVGPVWPKCCQKIQPMIPTLDECIFQTNDPNGKAMQTVERGHGT